MTWNVHLYRQLTNPVWWEDVFPGALLGLPRLLPALRSVQVLLLGYPVI